MWEEAEGEGGSPKFIGKSSHEWVFFRTTIKDLPALLKSLGPISAESLRGLDHPTGFWTTKSGQWEVAGKTQCRLQQNHPVVGWSPCLRVPSPNHPFPIANFLSWGMRHYHSPSSPLLSRSMAAWGKGTRTWHIKPVGLSPSTLSYKTKEQPVTLKLRLTRFPLPHLDGLCLAACSVPGTPFLRSGLGKLFLQRVREDKT